MKVKQTICLLNDSVPPLIDGVANTVMKYAQNLLDSPYHPLVITPAHPDAHDDKYLYPISRYPSIIAQRFEGYPAGVPFSPEVARRVSEENVAVLHSHCPIMSTFMARQLRQITGAPIVLTYHTKFDIDIEHVVKAKPMQLAAKKALVANISACDEVWAVSQGAGENLRSLGYEGDYIVMPNGVDLPRARATDQQIKTATQGCDLPQEVPVYLFVGRMMWYKGLRIILDALTRLKAKKQDFRMVFIGDGDNRTEIEQYAFACGISDKCIFTGPIRDREVLRAWYSRADLFLFPSSYDTNGLVVREAAACSLGAVLIKGSCAAEGVADGRNGFLIEETAESLAACLLSLNLEKMHCVGLAASQELYISWEEAVKKAQSRYEIVMDRHKNGYYPPRRVPSEGIMKMNGELMEVLAKLSKLRHR